MRLRYVNVEGFYDLRYYFVCKIYWFPDFPFFPLMDTILCTLIDNDKLSWEGIILVAEMAKYFNKHNLVSNWFMIFVFTHFYNFNEFSVSEYLLLDDEINVVLLISLNSSEILVKTDHVIFSYLQCNYNAFVFM